MGIYEVVDPLIEPYVNYKQQVYHVQDKVHINLYNDFLLVKVLSLIIKIVGITNIINIYLRVKEIIVDSISV